MLIKWQSLTTFLFWINLQSARDPVKWCEGPGQMTKADHLPNLNQFSKRVSLGQMTASNRGPYLDKCTRCECPVKWQTGLITFLIWIGVQSARFGSVYKVPNLDRCTKYLIWIGVQRAYFESAYKVPNLDRCVKCPIWIGVQSAWFEAPIQISA